jgi:long-chain fatty acid transport protein
LTARGWNVSSRAQRFVETFRADPPTSSTESQPTARPLTARDWHMKCSSAPRDSHHVLIRAALARNAGLLEEPPMNVTHHAKRCLSALPLVLLLATPAFATNGMYLAGYGSEAAGRAGANIAIADRALGLQANPAGIAQLQGQHFSVDLQMLAPRLSYGGDPAGNALDAKSTVFDMPSLSYVRGAKASPWTWGLGLISQGGMGATFEGYATPFGTKDGTYSEVRFLTATPTVAYAVNEDFAIGVSANAGYSDVTFRFFPNTSYYNTNGTPLDPSDDIGFFGANLSGRAKAFNYSGRLGLMWAATPRVQVGAIYQTKTHGDYKNGKLSLNETSLGLGEVKYDAVVEGFTWPEQYGLGVQVRPVDRWMLAADARRYQWSGAIEKIEVKGTNPDKNSPVTAPVMPFVFDWKDVWAVSLGAEFRASNAVTLRGGWNFGQNPVPDATLNPLFPAITQQHATVGAGYTWGGNTVNLAVERAFEASQTNPSTNQALNPFGPGATVSHSQWTVSLGFSRAFSR